MTFPITVSKRSSISLAFMYLVTCVCNVDRSNGHRFFRQAIWNFSYATVEYLYKIHSIPVLMQLNSFQERGGLPTTCRWVHQRRSMIYIDLPDSENVLIELMEKHLLFERIKSKIE